jgi:F0F1-type ATP synthase delta subunit
MKEILNKGLKITKKISKGKATEEEILAYNTSMKVFLKIMDKLHANRQYVEGEVKVEKELPKELTQEEQDLIKRAIKMDYGLIKK